MCFEVGRIDGDRLVIRCLGSQSRYNSGEAPDVAPPLPSVVERLWRPIFSGRITPPQPIAIDEDNCLIPWFDGAICSLEWKEALWDKFVTGAPRTVTRQAICMANLPIGHARCQSSNPAIHWLAGYCAAMSREAQASIAALSKELGINPKTVAKWQKRETVEDSKAGPQEPRSTILSQAEEAISSHFGGIRYCRWMIASMRSSPRSRI